MIPKNIWLAVAFCGSLIISAQGAVLNFDDVPRGALPANYQGFSWGTDWGVESQSDYQSSTYGNTASFPSYGNAVFNGFGVMQMSLSNGAEFDFIGAYFTGWALHDGIASYTAPSITVYGYNGLSLVGSVHMNLPTASFAWLNANLDGVTRLVFDNGSTDGHWWLMDDFTYDSATVPDYVSTWAVTAFMFVLLGLLKRREIAQSKPTPALARVRAR